MTVQQISPARRLLDFEFEFVNQSKQDPTFGGKVNSNITARVITLCVSLLAHAEAVTRAVYICILNIKAIFVRVSAEFVQKQKEECSEAYRISVGSLFACFYQKVLATMILPSQSLPTISCVSIASLPAVAAPEILAVPLVEQAAAQAVVEEDWEIVSQDGDSQQEQEFVIIDSEPQPVVAQPPSPQPAVQSAIVQPKQPQPIVSQTQPAVQPAIVQPKQPQPIVSQTQPAVQPAIVQPKQPQPIVSQTQPAVQSAIVQPKQPQPIVSQTQPVVQPLMMQQPSAPQFILQPVGMRSAPQPIMAQPAPQFVVHPVIVPALPQEIFRIKMAQEREVRRQDGILRENRTRKGVEDIQARLAREATHANKNVSVEPNKGFTYLKGLDEHMKAIPIKQGVFQNNSQWKILDEQKVGEFEVGICHYLKGGEYTLGSEVLAVAFDLQIGATVYPVRLFGLFEAHGGPRAALYVKEHLQEVLAAKLKEHNPQNLTQEGIWNALKLTPVQLNQNFTKEFKNQKVDPLLDEMSADHGTTLSLALWLNENLWVSNAGTSRIVLSDGEIPVQLTGDANPNEKRYMATVEDRGGFVKGGLVNGEVSTARGIGFYHLKGAVSSRPKIVSRGTDDIAEGSYLFLGSSTIFATAATRQIVKALRDNRELEPKFLAHDCVYSAFSVNNKSNNPEVRERALSCMVIKIEDWDLVTTEA